MKKVLVTGGNKGIGKAICKKLLEEYPNDVHVLLGSRDVSRGKQAIEELKNEVKDCSSRLGLVHIDTSSEESVQKAAAGFDDNSLYGIVNNAGVAWAAPGGCSEMVNTNYFGIRRVNDAFTKKLIRPGGRIVNVSSASGPMFVAACKDSTLKDKLACPWKIDGISAVDEIGNAGKSTYDVSEAYGFSKALVNAYTWWHAKEERENNGVLVNSVTPGYIDTDLTAGIGASNPPSKGAIPPVFCLMSDEIAKVPSGRYYGSDCKRSPIDVYRGPGDPVYDGPDGP